MKLHKVKRPFGVFVHDVVHAGDDEHGTWLLVPAGASWTAPHDTGTMPIDALVLLAEGRPFVTWWVDDPEDRRVEVDVCLPAARSDDGWRFVDLELDPVRHEADGRIEVEDRHELAASLAGGWMTSDEASLAERLAGELVDRLARRLEPLGDLGWQRLERELVGR